VRLFTAGSNRLFKLIPGDVGRLITEIVSELAYPELADDAREVLRTLAAHEQTVAARDGRWFQVRIMPYRTLENMINGVAITFADITKISRAAELVIANKELALQNEEKEKRAAELVIANKELALQNEEKEKRAAEALRKANDLLRLAVVVRDAHDAITVQDLEGCIIAWNPGAVRMYGWSETEALAMNVHDRIPQGLRVEAFAMLAKLSQTEILEPYRTQRIAKDGTVKEVSIISTALVNEAGQMYAISTTERGGQ
jgi:two-component system CheB/CheR fusion protein